MRLGLSAEQLGARVGLSQSQISRLELGKQALTADLMYQIAIGLAIRPGDILDDDSPSVHVAVIGDLHNSGMLHVPEQRKFVPLPATPGLSVAFETARGWLVARQGTPRAEDDGKPFVIQFERLPGMKNLDVRTFEREGGGFSVQIGAPADRWLRLGDKRLLEVWRVLAEYRRINTPPVDSTY